MSKPYNPNSNPDSKPNPYPNPIPNPRGKIDLKELRDTTPTAVELRRKLGSFYSASAVNSLTVKFISLKKGIEILTSLSDQVINEISLSLSPSLPLSRSLSLSLSRLYQSL
jgi:hypothetical protein